MNLMLVCNTFLQYTTRCCCSDGCECTVASAPAQPLTCYSNTGRLPVEPPDAALRSTARKCQLALFSRHACFFCDDGVIGMVDDESFDESQSCIHVNDD